MPMLTPKRRCSDLRDRYYPLKHRPGEVFFRGIANLSGSQKDVVEIGCGRSADFLKRIAPGFRKAYGIDPEVSARWEEENIQLMSGNAENIDLPDESVDLVFSVSVVEHLSDPSKAFSEFIRVLRPGGRIVTRTPNVRHPPLLAARLLNHRTRQLVNSWATGTQPDDTFKTFYRLNTLRAFESLAGSLGLRVISLEYVSNHPQYFMFSRFFYRLAIAFERALLTRQPFAVFRQLIFADLQKPTLSRGEAVLAAA